MALVVKSLPVDTGDVRDVGSIPGSGRSPGGGHGNPLQYFSLENAMDRGAWWAPVHTVTQSHTQLKQLSTQMDQEIVIVSRTEKDEYHMILLVCEI